MCTFILISTAYTPSSRHTFYLLEISIDSVSSCQVAKWVMWEAMATTAGSILRCLSGSQITFLIAVPISWLNYPSCQFWNFCAKLGQEKNTIFHRGVLSFKSTIINYQSSKPLWCHVLSLKPSSHIYNDVYAVLFEIWFQKNVYAICHNFKGR